MAKHRTDPELEAIAGILRRAQCVFGLAGLILAAALAASLIGFDVPPFAWNPGLAFVAAAVAGILLGLVCGGPAVALPGRPAARRRPRSTTSTSKAVSGWR